MRIYRIHNIVCKREEAGVANPTLNKETGLIFDMKKDTGTLTPKAPRMLWVMTNLV